MNFSSDAIKLVLNLLAWKCIDEYLKLSNTCCNHYLDGWPEIFQTKKNCEKGCWDLFFWQKINKFRTLKSLEHCQLTWTTNLFLPLLKTMFKNGVQRTWPSFIFSIALPPINHILLLSVLWIGFVSPDILSVKADILNPYRI